MSMPTVAISEASYQLLRDLAEQTGQPPAAVLDQALAEFRRQLAPGGQRAKRSPAPEAPAEAELLDDCGRIRLPPRDVRPVAARVVVAGRRPVQVGEGEDE